MTFDILSFKATLDTYNGPQHDNLFQVTIPIASGLTAVGTEIGTASLTTSANAISAFCTATNLPGMQLATSGVNRYGYGPLLQRPFMPLFATCDIRVLADNDGAMWNFLQTWLNFILNFNVSHGIASASGFGITGTATGLGGTATNSMNPYEMNYLSSYAVDITIALYQPDSTQSMALVLRNAYPKFLGDPHLNYGSMNNLVYLPVSFAFDDWYNQAATTGNGISNINNPTTTNGIRINQTNG